MATLAITAISTSSPWFCKPWIWQTPAEQVDPEKEYLAVHTWGRVPLFHFPAFRRIAKSIWEELGRVPPGHGMIGHSGAFSPGWGAIAETLTIWTGPEALSEFYLSEAHSGAAKSWKVSPGAKVWVTKVWIPGSELLSKNNNVSKEMYSRIKKGEFRVATISKASLKNVVDSAKN